MGVLRDHPLTPEMLGMFSYIHKQRRDATSTCSQTLPTGRWIPGSKCAANTASTDGISTRAKSSRGRKPKTVTNAAGEKYTRLHLTLDPVRSVFAVSR
ncbi:MAG: hypothetical protein ACLR8Y_11570 [Alistipes indistinctus]